MASDATFCGECSVAVVTVEYVENGCVFFIYIKLSPVGVFV